MVSASANRCPPHGFTPFSHLRHDILLHFRRQQRAACRKVSLTSYFPITPSPYAQPVFPHRRENRGNHRGRLTPSLVLPRPIDFRRNAASPSSAAAPGLDLHADLLSSALGASRMTCFSRTASRRGWPRSCLLELVMRDNVQAVHRPDARALAVGQDADRARCSAQMSVRALAARRGTMCRGSSRPSLP